jgi:hypothetical protein
MNKYITKLKESSELRNKMILQVESGYFYEEGHSMYTYMTDSDEGNDNVRMDVDAVELIWDGWDAEYKVVSVTTTKYLNGKNVRKETFLAVQNDDMYYKIPGPLAKKEGLHI